MYEPRDYELVFAIILLTIVIAILGAPFSWNEYNKLIDREKIIRNFNNVLDRKDPSTELKIITDAVSPVRTIRPPAPAIRITQHKITDGYWCRDTTMNRGKAPTDVKECYQFMSDGTFKWDIPPYIRWENQ